MLHSCRRAGVADFRNFSNASLCLRAWPLPWQVASPRAIEALEAPEDPEVREAVEGEAWEDEDDAEDVQDVGAEPGMDSHNTAALVMTDHSQKEDVAWQVRVEGRTVGAISPRSL
ncbi:unnamed protein product [Symbiodinium natans]|uniref:Uncharacterized protein n=1 Tax=Symbiodinium natans TaxID=878477 RepID=A0A812SZ37_9DINO|nr:unnamed protein product [Symbiodinium natans]